MNVNVKNQWNYSFLHPKFEPTRLVVSLAEHSKFNLNIMNIRYLDEKHYFNYTQLSEYFTDITWHFEIEKKTKCSTFKCYVGQWFNLKTLFITCMENSNWFLQHSRFSHVGGNSHNVILSTIPTDKAINLAFFLVTLVLNFFEMNCRNLIGFFVVHPPNT